MGPEKYAENIRFPSIAQVIKNMYDADQAMRSKWETGDFSDESIDVENTERMMQIVADIGWPTVSKVGNEAAHDAWLLVQHADQNVQFQILCLELIKGASEGEVDRTEIAYLEDRIRVNQGRKQLYGTQFTQENNKHVPRPIEDEKNVDTRRAEIGMGPLADQVRDMYEKYPFTKEE